MAGLAGLRGQSLAGPLLRPGQSVSCGLIAPAGLVKPRRLNLIRAGGSLDVASTSSTINTPFVTVTPDRSRRAEQFRGVWRQTQGPAGEASAPYDFNSRFTHVGLGEGVYYPAWRFHGSNQFGDVGVVEVAYTLTRYSTPPALTVSVSPTSLAGYRNNGPPGYGPAYTDAASVSVSNGSGDYSYSWGGALNGGATAVVVIGQGTSSAYFGAEVPNATLYSGSFGVGVTDNQTGATGSAGGSLMFASG